MKQNRITIFLLLAICLAVSLALFYIGQTARRDEWKKRTTPLPVETIKLLCNSFGLSLQNSLCNGRREVYGLDFMNIIRDTFRPYEAYGIPRSEAATYKEVEQKIGRFKYECEPVVHQADGFSYFRCFYDLRGDRAFIMTIFYSYPEEAVVRITSTNRFKD